MSVTESRKAPCAIKPSVIATSIALSVACASSSWAQQAPASADKPEKTERIEVTGSRIPAANLEGASPVTIVDAATIKVDGLRSVENLLNNLPQVMADMGGNISNGATGTANVNLRGLGSTRTLVLVNGRRLPAGSPRAGTLSAASDLNQIPAPLIKRVEVLTGGAGSIYGSDAVSGVVNFIMNDSFEGLQLEVNQSFYNHQQHNPNGVADIIAGRAKTNPSQFSVPGDAGSDGKIYDANMLLGGNFANGKGNATVFFSYKREEALLQSTRDFSACSLSGSSSGFSCGGSSTSYPGRFILDGGNGASRTVADAAGATRAFASATDQYNFGPTNYYQRPSERYGFNASTHYDASDAQRIYAEFSFHDDHTVSQIAPSGLFSLPTTVHFENPLLSSDWKRDLGLLAPGDTSDIAILRRNVEGGGRQDDIRHTSFRTIIGVKGELSNGWNYDAFMQTAKVIYQENFKNEFSITRSARALDVVAGPNGQPVCRSVIDGSDTNCVPYNLWSLGKITPAALSYIQVPGFQRGSTQQNIQGATLSGDLGSYGWKLPAAKNGIGVAFGVERRVEKLDLDTDTAFTTGDLFGQGGPTTGVTGQYTVKEVFGEIRAPLIEGASFAHLLSVNGSVRHSDYSTNQKTDSYGLGIEWAPVAALRTRASYQRAARTANIHELYDTQTLGLFNLTAPEPCSGATPQATLVQCARTGVTPAQYGHIPTSPAGQYNTLTGGNTLLRPEKSDSYTLGVVFEPMRNLSATVDFFSLKLKEQISTLPQPVILSKCLDTGSPIYCNLITRDSAGSLWLFPQARIVANSINIGKQSTSGIDIGFNYIRKLDGLGSLSVNLTGTYLHKFETEPLPGQGTYDCKGYFGSTCGVPLPEWRHKLRGTWTTPWDVDLSMTWRHFASVKLDSTSSNPLLAGDSLPVESSMAAREYLDLAGTWAATRNLTLRAGINNVFDKDPPIVTGNAAGAPFGNGNTFPQVYDTLGRRVFVNATYKF